MKITYNENPLRTTVELDEHEREVLWLKLKIEELQDSIFTTHFHLEEGKYYDLERARQEVDSKFFYKEEGEMKSKLDQRVDEMLEYYLGDLMGTHIGDCTCFAASCGKCHAENILNIDTLKPYPGKHVLYKIQSAFDYHIGEWKDGTGEWKHRTLAEALEYLKGYKVSLLKPSTWLMSSQEEYESHIPRWTEEGRKAYAYLLEYANTHFPGVAS